MNIKARINARKILLVYRYEVYFLHTAGSKDMLLDEINKIDKSIDKGTEYPDIDMKAIMQSGYYEDFDTEIAYIIEQCFENLKNDEIDFDYLKQIGPTFWIYQPVVKNKVDDFTISFGYDEMDMIDRVIFVLGYAEYLLLKTPKEIILNEMVELAKRYGDASSSKLINGIGHKILGSVDEKLDE